MKIIRKTVVGFFLMAAGLLPLAEIATAACTVSSTSVNFGMYDVLSQAPILSSGSVTVACDPAPGPVSVAIGQSPGAGFNPRQMKHASFPDRLNYNLFTDPSMTVIWGDGTGGTSTVTITGINRNRPRTRTVYGRMPQGQDISGGQYSDVLVVTVTF